jgi:hypothetical protein
MEGCGILQVLEQVLDQHHAHNVVSVASTIHLWSVWGGSLGMICTWGVEDHFTTATQIIQAGLNPRLAPTGSLL